MRRLQLPQEDEPGVPWDFLLLQAACGDPRVRPLLFRAVRPVVGLRLGMRADRVEEAELERALAKLPADPSAWLTELLARLELDLPPLGAPLRLGAGPIRPGRPVSQDDLLHDAVVVLRASYGREGFFEAFEAVDQDPGCARAGVVMAVYLLLLLAV